MDLSAVQTVRDALASIPDSRFNMMVFIFREDGTIPSTYGQMISDGVTIGDLTGYVVAVIAPDTPVQDSDDVMGLAAGLLGLDDNQKSELFLAVSIADVADLEEMTVQQAIDQLDWILAGNEPDWSSTITMTAGG